MTTYIKNLSEPWFSLILLKIKTVEGRLNKGDFNKMKIGDIIIFQNTTFGFLREFHVNIIDIKYYTSFEEYLSKETLERCLPGINSLSDGIDIYRSYYKIEDEIKYGIVSFTLSSFLS